MRGMSYLLAEPADGVVIVEATALPTAVIRHSDAAMADLPALFDASFAAFGQAIALGSIYPDGPAIARYTQMDPERGTCAVEIGFPVATPVADSILGIEPGELPAGLIGVTSYFGSYDGLPLAWQQLMVSLESAGYECAGPGFESYFTQPTPDADPATLRTDLCCPVVRKGN